MPCVCLYFLCDLCTKLVSDKKYGVVTAKEVEAIMARGCSMRLVGFYGNINLCMSFNAKSIFMQIVSSISKSSA